MGRPSVRANIQLNLHKLSAAERRVADYVFSNSRSAVDMTMMDIAEACNVSDATVLRFVRDIGFEGFNAFKIALAADLLMPSDWMLESVKPDDSYEQIIHKVIQSNIQLLQATIDTLCPKALEQAIEAIRAAKRIYLLAVATSEPMAIWLYDRMFRLGYPATAITDTYRQLVQASIAEPGDLYIVLSRSGAPTTLAEAERIIKQRNPDIKIISITCEPQSIVAQNSDICLQGVSREVRNDIAGPMASISAIIDIIYTCLELADINKTIANQSAAWKAMEILRMQTKNK